MISSILGSAELLYFKIFVMAEIAFSVGFTFSGSRLLGACTTSIKRGMVCAQVKANWSPAN